MIDATRIVGIGITCIFILITILTGVSYYFIIHRYQKRQKQVDNHTDVATVTRETITSTTLFSRNSNDYIKNDH